MRYGFLPARCSFCDISNIVKGLKESQGATHPRWGKWTTVKTSTTKVDSSIKTMLRVSKTIQRYFEPVSLLQEGRAFVPVFHGQIHQDSESFQTLSTAVQTRCAYIDQTTKGRRSETCRYRTIINIIAKSRGVLWCSCLFACVCTSTSKSPELHTRQTSANFCACYLWPWFAPFLVALWYVAYFRFYGWRNICMYWLPNRRSKHMYTQSDSTGFDSATNSLILTDLPWASTRPRT